MRNPEVCISWYCRGCRTNWSVKFGDSSELHLCRFSTNQLKLGNLAKFKALFSVLSKDFSLPGPFQKLKKTTQLQSEVVFSFMQYGNVLAF